MLRRLVDCSCGFLAVVLALSTAKADEKVPSTNVLVLAQADLEPPDGAGSELANPEALVDGEPRTFATISTNGDATQTLICGFGGETVAIEELSITLPPEEDVLRRPNRVDLLVSTLSPHAGFQSVRSDPLAATAEPQRFPLRPIGAKWIMLRFATPEGAGKVAIAELSILGHLGAPRTLYQFKEAPTKAFDLLRRLEKTSTIKVELTPDELSLFADARDGKLDQWSFDEAALMASGIVDAAQRKSYLKRLDKIETAARRATTKYPKPFDKGRALLAFLHAEPMAKGYVSAQTDVAKLLDDGTFNCVSSATLYNILGRRLGLDCRGVEVPQHAFSVVYDGVTHADVETTTDGGFDPARDKVAKADFESLTGFAYIPESNREQRREISDLGLVALTYYNHGVALSQEKRFHEALLAYFRAMSLDLELDSAVKNALAALANWSLELSTAERFEDALNVLSTGLDLAPEDATLVNNRQAVWGHWADSLIAAGQDDEAIALLRRAAEQVPDGGFLERQAWVFVRRGEELIKSSAWAQAIALVEPASQKLEGPAREALLEWGAHLHHRWAQAEQQAGNYAQAVDVIERALAAQPDEEELVHHLAYVVQEWARVKQQENSEQAVQLVAEMLSRYGKYQDVQDVADAFAYRAVNALAEQGRYDDSQKAAKALAEALKNPELGVKLLQSAVDKQADAMADQEKWEPAIAVYLSALKAMPGDEHLSNNLQAMWSRWASSYQRKGDWAAALDVYDKQRKASLGAEHAVNNIRYGVQEWARAAADAEGTEAAEKVLSEQLIRFKDVAGIEDVAIGYFQSLVKKVADEGNYDDALAAAKRAGALLSNQAATTELFEIVYDAWATAFARKGEWQQATDVYTQAINVLPTSEHLAQNAAATWHQRAKTYMDNADWAGAAAVYEKALQQFPENGTLQNNLEYCREKLKP